MKNILKAVTKTFRCILTDLGRILTSPYFFAGIAIMTAVCCTENVYISASGKSYNVVEAFFELRDDNFLGITAEYVCCRFSGTFEVMFMGVIASFPFIFINCGEQKSGLRLSICREGVFNYSLSKTLSAMLSAGLVCGLGYLLFTGMVFLMFPSGENYAEELGFMPRYMYYLTGTALSGVRVSFLPLIISAFTSNKYFCVCVPFLIDYLRLTAGNKLLMGIHNTGRYDNYDLYLLVYPDYMSQVVWDGFSQRTLGTVIFACSALIAFFTFYFARKGRVDVGA